MKKSLIIVVTTLILVGVSHKVHSQYNISAHLGPAVLDKHAMIDMLGWNIGLQVSRPVFDKGLGLFAGFEVTDHGKSSDVGDYYNFHNLSLTTGMKYRYHATEKFGLFASTGLLINYLIRTDVTHFGITGKIDSPFKLGLKVDVGLLFYQKVSLSLNFLGPKKYDMTGERIINKNIHTIDLGEESVTIIALVLGYRYKF